MIHIQDVTKIYVTDGHKKIVLDHASTTIDTAWSYGIFGPNGAGKSTTLRLIAGTELPNSGKIKKSIRTSWPLGFRRRLSSDDDRPRKRLLRRQGLRRERADGDRLRRVLRRPRASSRSSREDLFLGNAGAPRFRPVDGDRIRLLSRRRGHRGRRQPLPAALRRGARGPPVALHHHHGVPRRRHHQEILRTRPRAPSRAVPALFRCRRRRHLLPENDRSSGGSGAEAIAARQRDPRADPIYLDLGTRFPFGHGRPRGSFIPHDPRRP